MGSVGRLSALAVSTGALEHWSTGALEHWSTGALDAHVPDRLHLELDALSDFLVDEAGQRIAIDVDQPLKPANQRLMDFLGVEVRVTATAGGVSCLVGGCEWRFDGDYDERAAAIEKHREEEHDYIPAARFHVRSDAGREALEAMDGLFTQAEHRATVAPPRLPALPDPPPLAEVPKPEEEVEMARGGVVKWSREQILEAIQAFHAEHGRPPKADEWIKSAPDHPTQSTVTKHFGTWASAIEAAGFERPKRGGVVGNTNRSSMREPKARETRPKPSSPAAPSTAGATADAAVGVESPSLVGSEAGSRTDEQPGTSLVPTLNGIDAHGEWYESLPHSLSELRDAIALEDELAALSARRRDALQAFLDVLEAV